MILVIGGHASGKRAYVEQLGYGPADFCCGPEEQGPVAYGIQDWVAKDPAGAMDLLPALLEKQVVVCDEVGCGVVPMEAEQRLWRERTGRLTCALAKRARRVERILCGLPMVLKEDGAWN